MLQRINHPASTLVAAASLLAAGGVIAQPYKCVGADGSITYQQRACAGAAAEQRIAPTASAAGPPPAQQASDYWSLGQQLERFGAAAGPAASEAERAPLRREIPPRPRRVEILNAIRSREILPGMRADEVEQALGPPRSTRRGADGQHAWSYRGTDAHGHRRSLTVHFRDDVVTGSTERETRAEQRFELDRGRWLER